MAKTITLTIDDDVFDDYAESVGAYSDDPAVVAQLVVEALQRHVVYAAGRVMTNRAVEAAHAQAREAQKEREAKLRTGR